MKNLVQIICGCAAAETIEECARVPLMLGATIIVVHGIWPRIDHPTDELTQYSSPENWVLPTHQVDDVKQIALKNGWHFIQMDKFAYNGEQYNVALDYIKSNHLPCDYLWFVDADECIDPANIDLLLSEINLYFTYDITGGNYSITIGDAVWLERETFFDGNYFFKSPISYGLTSVPLLHLHQFRKNAAGRILNGKWHGAGMEIDIASLQSLPDTPYIRELKAKYPLYFVTNFGCSYIGSSIYEKPGN